jgi:uncharacterized repeat protein (TIGR01451 family)
MQARSLTLVRLFLFTATVPVLAAAPDTAPPRLEVTVSVQREAVRVDANGRSTVVLEPVKTAIPGDVLVYRLRATNLGLGPAREAKIDDPIPSGTVLMPDSVGKNVHASLDGGKTWQEFPATITRKRDDGQVERVPAPASAYTNLRWMLEDAVPPGGTAEVGFKVQVQ